jgi:Fic family protein
MLEEIKKFYRIGLVYSSNAIEGFTYTESETKVLLEDGLTAGGKPFKDAMAVVGHAKAYDYMFSLLKLDGFAEKDLLFMHSLLAGSLDNQATPGTYRDINVFITGSKNPLPDHVEVPRLMAETFGEFDKAKDDFPPVILAAWLHKEIARVHPFADGNGRVARLAMNTVMIQRGHLPIIIPPILRSQYIQSLEISRVDPNSFYGFICECQINSQSDMIRLLKPLDSKDAKIKGPKL